MCLDKLFFQIYKFLGQTRKCIFTSLICHIRTIKLGWFQPNLNALYLVWSFIMIVRDNKRWETDSPHNDCKKQTFNYVRQPMLSSFNVHSCVYIKHKNIFIPDFCFLDEYISKKIDTTQRLIQNKKLSKLSMRRKFGFDKMIEKS